jgi:hypothetical protein
MINLLFLEIILFFLFTFSVKSSNTYTENNRFYIPNKSIENKVRDNTSLKDMSLGLRNKKNRLSDSFEQWLADFFKFCYFNAHILSYFKIVFGSENIFNNNLGVSYDECISIEKELSKFIFLLANNELHQNKKQNSLLDDSNSKRDESEHSINFKSEFIKNIEKVLGGEDGKVTYLKKEGIKVEEQKDVLLIKIIHRNHVEKVDLNEVLKENKYFIGNPLFMESLVVCHYLYKFIKKKDFKLIETLLSKIEPHKNESIDDTKKHIIRVVHKGNSIFKSIMFIFKKKLSDESFRNKYKTLENKIDQKIKKKLNQSQEPTSVVKKILPIVAGCVAGAIGIGFLLKAGYGVAALQNITTLLKDTPLRMVENFQDQTIWQKGWSILSFPKNFIAQFFSAKFKPLMFDNLTKKSGRFIALLSKIGSSAYDFFSPGIVGFGLEQVGLNFSRNNLLNYLSDRLLNKIYNFKLIAPYIVDSKTSLVLANTTIQFKDKLYGIAGEQNEKKSTIKWYLDKAEMLLGVVFDPVTQLTGETKKEKTERLSAIFDRSGFVSAIKTKNHDKLTDLSNGYSLGGDNQKIGSGLDAFKKNSDLTYDYKKMIEKENLLEKARQQVGREIG